MTPDQERKLNELYEWMQARKAQLVDYPLDPVSQAILEIPDIVNQREGATSLTQPYSVSGGAGGSITGPKAYLDTLLLRIDGDVYEFPYVAKNP